MDFYKIKQKLSALGGYKKPESEKVNHQGTKITKKGFYKVCNID